MVKQLVSNTEPSMWNASSMPQASIHNPPSDILTSILIVDDNPAKLTALAATLDGMNIRVVTATSGMEALRHLLEEDFAVVLLDVNMPIMDGFETAKMIRSRPKSEHLPIIFITAERLTDDAKLQGYGLGAVDYILSPVLPQILRSKVATFADLYQLRKQSIRYGDEMLQQKKRLEEQVAESRRANLAKSRFLSHMTHELRTPLNAILGFSNLMLDDPSVTPKQRENLNIITHSGEQLLGLVNDVLDMAKIEAGHSSLDVQPFDLKKLLADIINMMRIRSAEKCLQLLAEQALSEVQFINADADKLRQIIVNLLSNAIKYTNQGGVVLRIKIDRQSDKTMLYLEVEDTGIGINKADQPRIFEPFTQLEPVSTQKGTGLGLTLVQEYVELMGGSIQVESEPGAGSLFSVALPVQLARSSEVLSTSDDAPVIGLEAGQPAYRILVVEDQPENQLLLQSLLQNVGLTVEIANNGVEAIALFQRFKPQFIWMDARMPVMDGLQATRQIRALEGGRDVKIAAVTASAFVKDREEIMAAGMDDFIRKPYRAADIFNCLTKHLGIRFTHQAADKKADIPLELSAHNLASLPAVLRQKLANGLILGDVKQLDELVQNIEQQDSTLAATLKQHIARFNYLPILNVLESLARSECAH